MRLAAAIAVVFSLIWAPGMALASVPIHADAILIEKAKRKLTLLKDGKAVKSYRVSLGPNSEGPKTRQGDGRTPEGHYVIDRRNRYSHYHRALHVSYPNAADRARAQKLHVSTGGDIMIHGLPNGYGFASKVPLPDWTLGCIAVNDEEIEQIWSAVPDGAPVEIKP